MAGPWFTVQKSGEGWRTLDHIWISNGNQTAKGRVELRVELEEMDDEPVESWDKN